MRRRYTLRVVVLLLLALLYGGLTQKYRAYEVDNPWELSFSYNLCHSGVETDTFAGLRYPGGMDGVHLFGKVPARVQCLVLDRTGWTPGWVVCLNVIFGMASLWLWWSFLACMGYRERWIAIFILLLGVSEPIVSMMEKGRYEFFTFFLLSLALWLGVQSWELAALLVVMFSVETQPMGVVPMMLVMLLLTLRTENQKKLILKAAAAGIVMAAFYLRLHPGAIQEMIGGHPYSGSVLGGILQTYFIERRRHLPELAMLLLGGGLCWRHRGKITDRTGLWLALTAGSVFFIMPHPNVAYAAFLMPFLLWAALEGYDHSPHLRWVPALVFVSILFQYAYLYKVNRQEGFRGQDFAAVRESISESERTLQIPDSQAHICGDYSLWFAHPDNFSTCSPHAQQTEIAAANLFLCFDEPLQQNGLNSPEWLSCSKVNEVVPLRELSSLTIRGHLLHVYGKR